MRLIVLIITLLLTGCSEDKTDPRLKIEDIAFESPAIEACIAKFVLAYELIYAEELTEFFCDAPAIQSTSDLKHFSNIKSISFYELATTYGFNPQDFAQVSSFSLTLSIISSLDISALTNLESVEFTSNAKLTDVDFSYNTKLQKIYITRTPISSLNTDNMTELKELSYQGGFSVEVAGGLTSSLSVVNFANNLKLEELSLGFLPLKEISLVGLDNLEIVRIQSPLEKVVFDLPNLRVLDLSGTELTEINLPLLPKLEALDNNYGKLERINVDNNLQLNRLKLIENPLSEATLEYLATLPDSIEVIL